jgi:16S rRNA A1518/A1519 N6-dimethyltransferase RsmA/KsgA/DIM1 with predicted DNA glycosylase/AP lyase activity
MHEKNMLNTEQKQQYFGKDLEDLKAARNYYKWIISIFKPYLGETIAEIGAGSGNFTSFLSKEKIKSIFAFEPSDNMYPLLSDKFKKDNRVTTINTYFKEKYQEFLNFFDSLLYVNVLEHIEEDKKQLSYAYKTIKQNGYILIFAPALSFLYSEFDRRIGHFRRYCKTGLINIVRENGFSIENIRYFDLAGIIPWYISFVLLKKVTTNKANISLYDKLVVPPMRLLETLIPAPTGKNLLLIGKKI